ncbi:MAG: bifunctional riboflavin kinase/FAD synthetase [Bacteroidales bacterium]|nr:bifunctional riboflavin kinase/FAD synthetase [Bacteroidales bacterium]MDD4656579.1 bifunctional riboflavin kinase/FAD synthetase [Bacteroidales bacterium]
MVVAATGFFDGVHRGHRSVLNRVSTLAKEQGALSAVVTFWPHPRAVLQQDAAKFRLLTTLEEKKALLHALGIDHVHVLTFNKEFAKQSTAQFFSKYLKDQFNVSTLVAGYDHRVGNDINQTQQEMFEIARKYGINPIRVEEFENTEEHVIISSTKIREALCSGNLEVAAHMLGYNYNLKGVVVEGNKLGRTMGFPTANIKLYEPLKLLPANGVYAVWVERGTSLYKGIANIGTRPTVSQSNEQSIEVHIMDFDEDIYGLPLKVEFAFRLRDEQKFSSLDFLKEQLSRDKARAESLLIFNGQK